MQYCLFTLSTKSQGIDSKGNILTISDFTVGDVLDGNLLLLHRNFYPITVISKTDAIIVHMSHNN
ncbi:MAG: hypothetical protein ACREVX_05270 [Clostridium sp.]|uniref:hypothetical protein n=1 Tax=Clostridium sp. TaxID=1506 RepID=UPI003D6D0D5C